MRFVGCKLDWLNLRSAQLEDVLFEDCTLEELDLTGGERRTGCVPRDAHERAGIDRARLADVDLRGGLRMASISDPGSLRGATVDAAQLLDLAPLLADHLGGIRVEG